MWQWNILLISDDQLIPEELNQFLKKSHWSFKYTGIYSYLIDKSELPDPVNKTISKYKNHPRVLLIKDKIIPASFSVKEAFLPDIEKVLRNVNKKEASTFRNITPKTLRKNKQSCSETLTELFNNILLTFSFPTDRKVADVSPVFKKNDPLKTKGYRTVSLLSCCF